MPHSYQPFSKSAGPVAKAQQKGKEVDVDMIVAETNAHIAQLEKDKAEVQAVKDADPATYWAVVNA